MSDVFVSYKAEDRPRVEPLVEALESEGLSVWWDARVSAGEAWRETITEELDNAPCVIVVWSRRSTGTHGRFVRDEASHAQQHGAYLPVTIDRVQPPLGFGEVQAISLSGWKGDSSDPRYRAVSSCVRSMVGRAIPTTTRDDRDNRLAISRRAALAGGGAVVLAAAGAGAWFLLRPIPPKTNAIAVLPFANLSGDPSQNYFSDGIAEEVRSALAALGGIQVVARTSSEMLRNADAVTVARRLNVANVVTGSVRRSASTVRVSAQLVNGRNGLELWSETFDRPIGDVLQIQSDIASNVARSLSAELGGAPAVTLPVGGTSNPQAQDLLLRATATQGDDGSEPMLRSIALLKQATGLDPNYAEAFARLGLLQEIWSSTYARNTAERDRWEGDALRSVKRAMEIEPNLAVAHSALGVIYHNQLKMRRSVEQTERSVQLPGAQAAAFFDHALTLSQVGRQKEGEIAISEGVALDPLNARARAVQSRILFYGRHYPQSIEAGRRALIIRPANVLARAIIGWDLIQLGRMGEASRTLRELPDDDYRRIVGEAVIAIRSGRKDEARGAITALRKRYGDGAYYQEGEIYAQLGDRDKAIQALETAWNNRDTGLASMQGDPFLDPVRKDPRFTAIANRVFG
jgi:serine/threonine-protein kinase